MIGACAGVCALKASFAELIFPFLVHHIQTSQYDTPPQCALTVIRPQSVPVLTSMLMRHVVGATDAPAEVVRLVLSAFNTLRKLRNSSGDEKQGYGKDIFYH